MSTSGSALNDALDWEQLVTMFYRYAGSPTVSDTVTAFSDADSVSSWASDAMRWAVETGLITGVGGNTLDPQGDATRAQVATTLMRFIQQMA